MVTLDESYGKVSKELECFVSEHQDGIRSVLEQQISAARYPAKLQARYLPFATWEIVATSLDTTSTAKEEIVLDVFINTGFNVNGNYKQLIVRRYASGDCPFTREVLSQKYIMLHEGRNPVDALQRALTDVTLD